MNSIIDNPQGVHSADIIVGIPSFNEADSIAVPTDAAGRGLEQHFPELSSVIINVDNHSEDGTKEAFLSTPTKVPKVYVSTENGVRGKGNNLRNLFQAAVELDAKAVVVVDADLNTITPGWIRYLAEPILGRFDYVSPLYVRHKYDGTITNHIAYPMLRSLFGIRVRQPIGGDFGFSGRLARAFLTERLWNETVGHFGIDVWMTTIAIARRFNVCQAFLGSPKGHRPKDPAGDLTPMFKQVVGTLFDLMREFEYIWKDRVASRPSAVYGFGLGIGDSVDPIEVDTAALLRSFQDSFDTYGPIWDEVVFGPVLSEFETLKQVTKAEHFHFPTELWARVVFDFAVAARKRDIDQGKLLEALVPFYHSRVLSFVNRTSDMDTREAEEYLENINRIFEKEKYYLIEHWDTRGKSRDRRLFK